MLLPLVCQKPGPVLLPSLITVGQFSVSSSFGQQAGEHSWQLFWLNYMLLQLVSSQPELQTMPGLDPLLVTLGLERKPQHANIVDWLVHRAKTPQSAPQANDELLTIDRWLQ